MPTARRCSAEEERLLSWRPEKLILRVDRTDLSKNIVRGFLAYERMLEDHHELHGDVQFWAYLQPSRQDIDDYRAYLGSVLSVAARINRKFSRGGWTPIRVEVDDVMARALAGYRQFDVLLVNPIYDGMNLVAKEGVLCNRRDGVLVLSENGARTRSLVISRSASTRSTSTRPRRRSTSGWRWMRPRRPPGQRGSGKQCEPPTSTAGSPTRCRTCAS